MKPLVEEAPLELMERARKVFPATGLETARSRLGDSFEATVQRLEAAPWKKALLCECERVTVAEFEQVASEDTSYTLNDIRRRTRMGMGTCQGSFCGIRGIGTLMETGLLPCCCTTLQEQPTSATKHTGYMTETPTTDLLRQFQEERWHGIRPALWGNELRETELLRSLYGATLNINGAKI